MAYAFDKVSDYFRRQKSGDRGSLNRGTTGAPPPTAAAESLAKQAETSAEIGSSDTSAFRANRGVGQSATQQALTMPAQKQAQEWGSTQEKKAQDFQNEGEQRIGKTYQAYDPNDIAKVEAGDQGAIQKMGAQRQYTGQEITWQPYQVQDAQLDTTSMLQGGVGGLQAALQKNKGGRYTGGMAALDASLLAGNRGAMQGLQQQLGDIYQGTREKKAALEQTDEKLAKSASERATGIAGTVKSALESRGGNLRSALEKKAQEEFAKLGQNVYGSQWEAIQAQQPMYQQAYSAALPSSGLDVAALMRQRQPAAGEFDVATPIYSPVTQQTVSYTQEMSPEYMNIMSALGVAPEAIPTMSKSGYGFDAAAVQQAAQSAGQQTSQQWNQLLQGGRNVGTLGYDQSQSMYVVDTPSGQQVLVTRDPRTGVISNVEAYRGGL